MKFTFEVEVTDKSCYIRCEQILPDVTLVPGDTVTYNHSNGFAEGVPLHFVFGEITLPVEFTSEVVEMVLHSYTKILKETD